MGFVVSLDLQIPSDFVSFNLGELVALFGSHCDDCVSATIGVQHTSCKSDSYSLAGIGVWRWAGVDPSTFNIHFLSLNFLQVVCHLIIGRSWRVFFLGDKCVIFEHNCQGNLRVTVLIV